MARAGGQTIANSLTIVSSMLAGGVHPFSHALAGLAQRGNFRA